MEIKKLPRFRFFTHKEVQDVVSKPIEELTSCEKKRLLFVMIRTDEFRCFIRRKLNEPNAVVNLIDINKLNHSRGSQHYLFNAVDFWIGGLKKPLNINNVVELLIQIGFNGIGVYRNEKGYFSFHGDNRKKSDFQQWKGTKENHEDDWTYSDLITF